MTEELAVAQGKVLSLRFVLGTVIGQEGWTETRTSGTTKHAGFVTGSGHVVGGGTTVNTVDISRQEVWVRHDDGREECIAFFKKVIKTRPGHRVLIAIGGKASKPELPLAVHLYNDSSTHNFVDDNAYLMTIGMVNMFWYLVTVTITVGLCMTIIGIPVAIVFSIIMYVRRNSLRRSICDQVLPRLKELVRTSQRAAEPALTETTTG